MYILYYKIGLNTWGKSKLKILLPYHSGWYKSSAFVSAWVGTSRRV